MRALGAGPAMVDGRRAPRRPRRDRGRVRSWRWGSPSALSPLAPIGPGPARLPRRRRRLRLDRPRVRLPLLRRGARRSAALASRTGWRHTGWRRGRARPERDPAWNRAAAAGLPPSAVLGIRSALGWPGSGRDAAPGALCAARCRGRRRGDRDVAHLRREPQRPRLATTSLRVELGLRPAGGLLGRREPAGGRDGRAARPRSRRGPLGRASTSRAPTWTGSPCPCWPCARAPPVQPLHALRPRAGRRRHRSCWDRRPWRRCTRTSATPSWRTPDGHTRIHLRIVGTATLPTIGGSGDPALEMGTGAVMATSLFSATDLNQQGEPVRRPDGGVHHRPARRERRRRAALARPHHRGAGPAVGSRRAGRRRGQRAAPGRDRRLPTASAPPRRSSPPSWPPGRSARSG